MADINTLGFALLAASTFLCISSIARAITSLVLMLDETKFLNKVEALSMGEAKLNISVEPEREAQFIQDRRKEGKAEIRRLKTTVIERLYEYTAGFVIVTIYVLFIEYSFATMAAVTVIGVSMLIFVIAFYFYNRRQTKQLELYGLWDREGIIIPK